MQTIGCCFHYYRLVSSESEKLRMLKRGSFVMGEPPENVLEPNYGNVY